MSEQLDPAEFDRAVSEAPPREANGLIHQPLRLKIGAALNGLSPREAIEFTRLKSIVEATDGNLGAHLSTLEQAGYVQIEKDFVGKKPRTRIALTRDGRKALVQHVAYLRDILDGVAPTGAESVPRS